MTEITNTEYHKLVGAAPPGSLSDLMDLSGERGFVVSTTVTIPGTPAYSFSPNSRSHWRTRHRESQELKQRTMSACVHNLHVSAPVVISWTVYLAKHGKPRDRDNLLPCLKPAQDAFVTLGYIDGDGPKVVVDTPLEQVIWSVHKGQPRIVATVSRRNAVE